MRLLEYPARAHPKNQESMARMCAAYGIVYEQTNERERLRKLDYHILWLPLEWYPPDEFPTVKILYGPHHFIFPEGPMIGPLNPSWASRCVYTCLSSWVKDCYDEYTKESVIPFTPLPFGIRDLPPRNLKEATLPCLVYFKRRCDEDKRTVLQLLQKRNIQFRIFTYGSYRDSDFQQALSTTRFVLWCGSHESQGFAFQECLARNVPILNFDATSMFDEEGTYDHLRGQKNLFATTAPYWSPQCGERATNPEELESSLTRLLETIDTYSPADFIRTELSDKLCMKRILDALGVEL